MFPSSAHQLATMESLWSCIDANPPIEVWQPESSESNQCRLPINRRIESAEGVQLSYW
jgi:hypothetical protein